MTSDPQGKLFEGVTMNERASLSLLVSQKVVRDACMDLEYLF